jgi:hypothetical protein
VAVPYCLKFESRGLSWSQAACLDRLLVARGCQIGTRLPWS